MTPVFKTRFAPSPTGFLHLGHVYAAKCAFDGAKNAGGTCLLRIEDIDFTRCKADYLDTVVEDLTWLGFEWPEPVRIQSQHRDTYDDVIANLQTRGLLYRCFKTRKERPQGLYRGQPLSTDEEQHLLEIHTPFAWRLSIERCMDTVSTPLRYEELGIESGIKAVRLDSLSDEVLARKDIGTSYHIACCHDDALQNITHVIRGQDIAEQTPLHCLLQHLMGWPTPYYHHHELLKNADGNKLSKRKPLKRLALLEILIQTIKLKIVITYRRI